MSSFGRRAAGWSEEVGQRDPNAWEKSSDHHTIRDSLVKKVSKLNWQEWKRGRTSYLESFFAGKSQSLAHQARTQILSSHRGALAPWAPLAVVNSQTLSS
jgi:hypothetical protein